METEEAFAEALILPEARGGRRDPHRLSLLARHLDPGERGRAIVSIPGGTLVATDRRVLELRPHLEVDGAWNVREFAGYVVSRAVELAEVTAVHRRTEEKADRASGYRTVEDFLDVDTTGGSESFLLSRGPRGVLTEAEFASLSRCLLGHAK